MPPFVTTCFLPAGDVLTGDAGGLPSALLTPTFNGSTAILALLCPQPIWLVVMNYKLEFLDMMLYETVIFFFIFGAKNWILCSKN